MEHAKRLYLVDEFDRQYKELQCPPAAVAKTRSAIQLTDTLRNRNLDEHEKVRKYVAELHRYLNIKAPQQQQLQQQQQQQQGNRVQKGTLYPFNTNTFQHAILPQRRPPALSSVTTRRQLKLPKKSKHADAAETAAAAAAAAAVAAADRQAETDDGENYDLFADSPTATAYDDDDGDIFVFVFAGSGPSTSKKPRGQKRKKVTEAYDFGRFSRDWSRLATGKNK